MFKQKYNLTSSESLLWDRVESWAKTQFLTLTPDQIFDMIIELRETESVNEVHLSRIYKLIIQD